MSDDESPDEVIADIISRLIGGDMGSGEQWRPAATLDGLVQGLVPVCEDQDESRRLLAKEILSDILLAMTYLELVEPDEEQEAFDRQWDKIIKNTFRIDRESEDDDEREE